MDLQVAAAVEHLGLLPMDWLIVAQQGLPMDLQVAAVEQQGLPMDLHVAAAVEHLGLLPMDFEMRLPSCQLVPPHSLPPTGLAAPIRLVDSMHLLEPDAANRRYYQLLLLCFYCYSASGR